MHPLKTSIEGIFSQNLQNLKRLTIFKKDVSIKISELPETIIDSKKPVETESIDVTKILNQTKLELNRLRNSKKEQNNQIRILEKRQLSLTANIEKQDDTIKKLTKNLTIADEKLEKSESSKKLIEQTSRQNSTSASDLRKQVGVLQDECNKLVLNNKQLSQNLEDEQCKLEQTVDENDVFLHGLWHKLLTCDLFTAEEIDKITFGKKINHKLT